jgi:hypothetical protein
MVMGPRNNSEQPKPDSLKPDQGIDAGLRAAGLENQLSAPEFTAGSQQQAVAGSSQSISQAAQASGKPTSPMSNVTSSNSTPSLPIQTPAVADDVDLIEKDWVLKVKQIVAKTRGDPYAQTKAINKLRADYLKKRYNKELKLIDG